MIIHMYYNKIKEMNKSQMDIIQQFDYLNLPDERLQYICNNYNDFDSIFIPDGKRIVVASSSKSNNIKLAKLGKKLELSSLIKTDINKYFVVDCEKLSKIRLKKEIRMFPVVKGKTTGQFYLFKPNMIQLKGDKELVKAFLRDRGIPKENHFDYDYENNHAVYLPSNHGVFHILSELYKENWCTEATPSAIDYYVHMELRN